MRALFAILLIVAVAACGETKPPSQSPTGQPAATSVILASPTPAAPTSPPSASPTATAAAAAAPTAKPTSSPTATPIPLPPTGALAANPKTKVKVAGATKVRYFKVAGSTPDELLASVVASSKAMCHSSDTLACVLDSPVVHWTKRTNLIDGTLPDLRRVRDPQVGREPPGLDQAVEGPAGTRHLVAGDAQALRLA